MRYLLLIFALPLLLSLVLAQQQPTPENNPPTGGTPPTFPPDTTAPKPSPKPGQTSDEAKGQSQARPLTSQEAKIQIVQKLQTQPGLSSRDIDVKVTKNSVVLSGSVPTENERALAERIAGSYAGERKVEDRLRISTGTAVSPK